MKKESKYPLQLNPDKLSQSLNDLDRISDEIYAKKEKALKRAKELEDQWYALTFIDIILPQFIKAISEKIGAGHHKLMGPFGLSNETSVYFYKTAADSKKMDNY